MSVGDQPRATLAATDLEKRTQFNLDVATVTSLLNFFTWSQNLDKINELLEVVRQSDLQLDVGYFTALLSYLAKTLQFERIYEALEEMRSQGLVPAAHTFVRILGHFKSHRDITSEYIFKLYEYSLKVGTVQNGHFTSAFITYALKPPPTALILW